MACRAQWAIRWIGLFPLLLQSEVLLHARMKTRRETENEITIATPQTWSAHETEGEQLVLHATHQINLFSDRVTPSCALLFSVNIPSPVRCFL